MSNSACSSGAKAGQSSGDERPVPRWSISTMSRVRRIALSCNANGPSVDAACPGPPASSTSGSGFGDSVLAGSTATKIDSLRPSGCCAILGHHQRAALHRLREFRQPAFAERDVPLRCPHDRCTRSRQARALQRSRDARRGISHDEQRALPWAADGTSGVRSQRTGIRSRAAVHAIVHGRAGRKIVRVRVLNRWPIGEDPCRSLNRASSPICAIG